MTHPFSETYISMAKAAEEIQALRSEFAKTYSLPLDIWEDDRNKWWLPRLDQLLGMLENGDMAMMQAVSDATHGGNWHEDTLSAVMREKYGKTWTGTEWRKA